MKYVDKPCLKKFMRARWETDNESLWINPKCCKPVQNWSQWPEYILGCLSLLILSSVIIAISFNFFLSDRNEYLDVNDKKIGIYEMTFLGLIGLALVAFMFVWIFHKSSDNPRINSNLPEFEYGKFSNN